MNPRCFRSLIAASLLTLVALTLPAPARADEAETLGGASRIVAIGGSVTEIIYALGAENRLAARDSTSLYPEQALQLPDIGYMRQLSPEGVLSVSPDGVIALQGSGPKGAVDVLKAASIKWVDIPDRFDHQGVVDKILAVGKALGEEAKAAKLAEEADDNLRAAEAASADVKERKRVLFILSMQGGRIMAAGADTSADGMIRLAGAVNAASGFSGYKQMADEAIFAAKPDAILMMDRGDGDSVSADEVFSHPALASSPAAERKVLIRKDSLFLLGFGPRTAAAALELSRTLYGEGQP